MTVLAANWENMGGGRLRKVAEGGVVGSQGDTITHPLKAPLGGSLTGLYTVERWTVKTVAAFPSGLGARTAVGTSSTLAGAFAATPA